MRIPIGLLLLVLVAATGCDLLMVYPASTSPIDAASLPPDAGPSPSDGGKSGDSNFTPPGDSDSTPPADGNSTPPADGNSTPPADGSTTPPADGSTTPPGDSNSTPPTDSNSTPPGDATADQPTPGTCATWSSYSCVTAGEGCVADCLEATRRFSCERQGAMSWSCYLDGVACGMYGGAPGVPVDPCTMICKFVFEAQAACRPPTAAPIPP